MKRATDVFRSISALCNLKFGFNMAQIFRTDSHDTIVAKLAELILKNNPGKYRAIYPGSEGPSFKLGGLIPDLVLNDQAADKAVLAIEVETQESISAEQAVARWKPISDKVPAFQLVVPKIGRAHV